MAKILKDKLQIVLDLTSDEVSCSAHYEVDCEYGGLGRKGLPIPLTNNQKTTIKSFGKNILTQIEAHEGIS